MTELGWVWDSSLLGVFVSPICIWKTVRVLKGVNSDVKHKVLKGVNLWHFAVYVAVQGLERSQFLMFCWNSHCRGLEMSQFGLKCHVCHSSHSRCPHRVLDEVQCLMLKARVTFCWPISSSCMMQGVTSLEVGLLVLCQVLGMGWWVQDDLDLTDNVHVRSSAATI